VPHCSLYMPPVSRDRLVHMYERIPQLVVLFTTYWSFQRGETNGWSPIGCDHGGFAVGWHPLFHILTPRIGNSVHSMDLVAWPPSNLNCVVVVSSHASSHRVFRELLL
jgi:hypothetical protein